MANLSDGNYSDVILHSKTIEDEVETREVIFPITRYANILNAPVVVSEPSSANNPDFLLVKTGTEDIPDETVFSMIGVEW